MILNWEELDFNQIRAKNGPYEFVLWTPEDEGKLSELRIIRRENTGGMITPIQDFSLFVRNQEGGKEVAEAIMAVFQTVSEYNEFTPLQ